MKSIRRWLHCRNQQERLSLYLDGQLSAEEAARLEKHLDECEACTEQLATLCSTVELLKSVPAPCMPRPVVIPESLIAAQRQTRRLDRAFYALRTSAVAVSAALVLSLSWNAFALYAQPVSTAKDHALEAPAAMMLTAPETEAVVEEEQEMAPEALPLAASSEPVEETAVVEAEAVAEAEVTGDGEAIPETEDAGVAAMQAVPTPDQQGVSAMALPEESGVELAREEELSAGESAALGDTSESSNSTEPPPLAREAPRDAGPGETLEKDVPAEAAEFVLGGGSGEPLGQRGEPVTWTIPRILATGFASVLAVLLGVLVWIDQRRVRH